MSGSENLIDDALHRRVNDPFFSFVPVPPLHMTDSNFLQDMIYEGLELIAKPTMLE